MLSEPQEFYKTLDVLDSTIVSLFTDHNTQVYNAMQAYQLEYGMTNIQVIKTLESVIELYKKWVKYTYGLALSGFPSPLNQM